MVGAALKKYAKEHNLKCDGGFIYGEKHGYAISMNEDAGIKRLFIHTSFPDAQQKSAFETMLGNADLFTQYRIQNTLIQDKYVCFIFTDKVGTMGIIGNFIDWLLPQLPQYSAAGADICNHCGGAMYGQGKWCAVDGIVYHMHESCQRSVTEKVRASETAAKEAAGGSYVTGLLGALIGGLLGAVVWGFILSYGWLAAPVGFLIGFLAEKGYTLLKGKLGKGKVIILIAIVLLSVAVGTILGEYLGLANELKEDFRDISSRFDFLKLMWQELPEFRSAVADDLVKNGLLGLLFAGLGAFGILRKTNAEVSDTKIKELK